ncbi:MAG: hypothetical protein ACK587_16230 [Cyanobacteriota bacterium]
MKTSFSLGAWLLLLSVLPSGARAQDVDLSPALDRPLLTRESAQAKPEATSNKLQASGINLLSARQTSIGVLVRVKRLIKPGADAPKEFARGLPIISTVTNLATLGLYNRALKSDGMAVRTTWLSLNCQSKTFNVAKDGYSWQSIYNDPHGQAEDLYYHFCEVSDGQDKPAYLYLPHADADMLRSAQLNIRSSRGEAVLPVEPQVPQLGPTAPNQGSAVQAVDRSGSL